MTPCPDVELLRRCFVDQDLSDASHSEIEDHVKDCRRQCPTLVEKLLRSDETELHLQNYGLASDSERIAKMLQRSPDRGIRFPLPPTEHGSLGQLETFHIQERLGNGTYGVVFKVHDEKLSVSLRERTRISVSVSQGETRRIPWGWRICGGAWRP